MQELSVTGNVIIERRRLGSVLGWPGREEPFEVIYASNLITTAGLVYYAQRLAGETTDNTFRAMVLFEGAGAAAVTDTLVDGGTLVAGSLKRLSAQYPLTDDQDVDNTGSGANVVSYTVTYASAEANNADIQGVAITNYAAGAPASAEPLLLHARFPSITKTLGTELRVTINHSVGNPA